MRIRKRGAWLKKASPFEQSLALQMDMETCLCSGGSLEAGAYGKVWARGFWLEDKEGKWGIWSRGLEGDSEGICLVLVKFGV